MIQWSLVCPACGKKWPDRHVGRCDCGAPLELVWYDGHVNEAGRRMVDRYGSLFPFDAEQWVSLGEGGTPLVPLPELADELGLAELSVKNETVNPTWSFKDRGTAACVAHARSLGYRRIGTVSTGNMAASVAAYGAAAGLETVVLVKGDIPSEKLAPVAIYGARLVRVDGPYDQLYERSLALGESLGIYFMNSDVPMRVAGSRTIAYELAEAAPDLDWVVVPVSAGGNFRGIDGGYQDFLHRGLLDRAPRLLAVQALGCSPVATAFERGEAAITPFSNPETVAHAIENPFPPSGNRVLDILRLRRGAAMAVLDEDILKAVRDLAECGLFVQPASATTLVALRGARASGLIAEGARVVLVLTGGGLKHQSALERQNLMWEDCKLADLSSVL